MSDVMDQALLGDPGHGGALFLLPREVRDEIYRLLVKGRYLETTWFYDYRYCKDRGDTREYTMADFSVLRLSKAIGREATEILYSESVFRFVVFSTDLEDYLVCPDLDRMKRLAPLIKRVILDILSWKLIIEDFAFRTRMVTAIRLFGGSDILCQSLQVRIMGLSRLDSLKAKMSAVVDSQLKAFVGFRTMTVEILVSRTEPVQPAYELCYCKAMEPLDVCTSCAAKHIRYLLGHIVSEIAGYLDPTLGPTILRFKSDTGKVPVPNWNVSRLDNIGLVGSLEFHPSKYSVENTVTEEDRSQ